MYKVHTIGECYLALGVNIEKLRVLADECINAGLIAFSSIKIIKKVQNINYELILIIGIHTDDIIGGIMGNWIARYDICGTDALFANYMKSCRIPSKSISVSQVRTSWKNECLKVQV